MSQRSLKRRAAIWLLALCAFYLGLAYVAAPEFWTWRERGFRTQRFEMVTHTPQGIPGDPINVGLVGTEKEVVHAFAFAGWDTADAITLRTAIDIGESVLFSRPYPDAPMSRLLFEGRPQDLAFEKPVGDSADRRHHVRFWQTDTVGDDGRPLWLGSASFDRGVGLSHWPKEKGSCVLRTRGAIGGEPAALIGQARMMNIAHLQRSRRGQKNGHDSNAI